MRTLPVIASAKLGRRSVAALAIAALVAGCGGDDGGDGGGGGTPPISNGDVLSSFFVESFDAFDTQAQSLVSSNIRYLYQQIIWSFGDPDVVYETYPLHSSGVYYAHAAGLTGEGQIIAINDDGFRPDHEAFAGKSVVEVDDFAILDHGTQVAAVAAGDSDGMIGMAPGADLILGGFDTFESSTATAERAEALGAVALNNSWAFVGTPIGQTSYDIIFGSTEGADYLAALTSYAANGVVIFAASNDFDQSTAGLMAALPVLEPGLEAGWLTAINADVEMVGDDIVSATRISGACLEAAPWCLAAEGSWDSASSAATDRYDFATGTSFAAPMIAGALAILGEAFPDMSPNDLRIRLLASADNTFAEFSADGSVELVEGFSHDYSDEWGHGFLDVKAALLPIGTATATMADGSEYDIAEPLAVEGGATGDAVTRALMGVSLSVDDALGAQFGVPADALVAQRSQAPLTDAMWRNWQNGSDASCCSLESFFPETQTVEAVTESTSVRFLIPQDGDLDPSYGLRVGQIFDTSMGEISVNLNAGQDGGALLPTWHSSGGSTIVAGELSLASRLSSATTLEFDAGFGGTIGDAGGADGAAAFNAASATLATTDVFAGGDRFAVSVGLPVAVTRGDSVVDLPVRTLSGTSEQQAIAIDLAPEDREIQLGFSYLVPLSESSDLTLSAMFAENAGHISGKSSSGILIGYRAQF